MLNLTVIAQSEQPSDPKENTIWIKSDISVQSVYITSIQSSTDILNIGDVWINTGSGYNINGLPNANDNMLVIKDNPYLQIVVGTAKQYIGDDSVWSRPDVQIYKNGEWHSEVLYIYSYGSWSEYGKFTNTLSYATITESSNNYLIFNLTDTGINSGLSIPNPVNVTKYNTMTTTYKCFRSTNSDAGMQYAEIVGLFDRVNMNKSSNISYPPYKAEAYCWMKQAISDEENVVTTVSTDISTLSGDLYIGILGQTQLSAKNGRYIYEIALIV